MKGLFLITCKKEILPYVHKNKKHGLVSLFFSLIAGEGQGEFSCVLNFDNISGFCAFLLEILVIFVF